MSSEFTDGKKRSFALIAMNPTIGSPILGKVGRYMTMGSPQFAAKKAARSRMKDLSDDQRKRGTTVVLAIQETTRGSEQKIFCYRATSVYLPDAGIHDYGDGRRFQVNYKIEIRAATEDEIESLDLPL